MQRLRLAARLVNAAPSLIVLLQSNGGGAWKDELSHDLDLSRQEMGPRRCFLHITSYWFSAHYIRKVWSLVRHWYQR